MVVTSFRNQNYVPKHPKQYRKLLEIITRNNFFKSIQYQFKKYAFNLPVCNFHVLDNLTKINANAILDMVSTVNRVY